MIVTSNGMDIIHVTNSADAEAVLDSLFERTSLTKKEIVGLVSLSGLSVSETVKVYNRFTREGQVKSNGKIRPVAA